MAHNRQVFSYQEIVTSLIKQQGIHEGIWGIFVEFGIQAINMNAVSGDQKEATLIPAAVIPLLNIGIQEFDKESNIAVDAAKVNPKSND